LEKDRRNKAQSLRGNESKNVKWRKSLKEGSNNVRRINEAINLKRTASLNESIEGEWKEKDIRCYDDA
jgi:hypothetical protein